jgi:cupin fold WbuC family metalloprotein
MKHVLRIIADAELAALSEGARSSVRLRKNLNIHPVLEDPVQRLFNAMEPGTYVRPHRHARCNGWELMLAVRGAFSLLAFDDAGKVLARADIIAGADAAAVEIPAYTWHAAVVTAPGTVMFEVKPGPYSALDDKAFAPWAPTEGEPAAAEFVRWYETARPADLPPPYPGCRLSEPASARPPETDSR